MLNLREAVPRPVPTGLLSQPAWCWVEIYKPPDSDLVAASLGGDGSEPFLARYELWAK